MAATARILHEDDTSVDDPPPAAIERLFGRGAPRHLARQQEFQDAYGKRRLRVLPAGKAVAS